MTYDLTTYSGLQAAVADTLNRPDLIADGQIAGFIKLAEAEMARELRRTVVKATLTFVTGTGSKALPATLAELRSIAPAVTTDHPRGGRPLKSVSVETLDGLRAQAVETGTPRYAAVIAQTVYVVPKPLDAWLVFDITYFKKPLAVSTDTAQLLEAPDLYLYGALKHAAPYLEHDERFPLWVDLFSTALAALNEKRQNEEFGMSLTAARLPVVFG